MPSIAIVTDTDSSIPLDIAEQYNIRQVSINIHFGDETFRAVKDLDDAQLFARVDQGGGYPTSSAPSPGQFANTYQAAFEQGADEVICFCVSGEVSATYSAALEACELLPNREITVVDTRSLSMGQGFMVLEAAQAAQAGASRDQIVAHTMEVGERVHLYAALSTLKYLAMSGRVKSLTAGVAGLLNVRPILTLREGKLDLLERVRTRKKAWARMTDLLVEVIDQNPIERLALLHINALEDARAYLEQLRARVDCPETIIEAELTPGLSLFGGTGLVGVTVVTGK